MLQAAKAQAEMTERGRKNLTTLALLLDRNTLIGNYSAVILKLKQHKQPLQQFLPEWHRTAHESDVALITLLKDALHFMIIERLSYTPASFSTTSLPEFLTMVRHKADLCTLITDFAAAGRPTYHI